VGSLRDATIEMLDATALDEPELRRARHVITENQRVSQAANGIRQKGLRDLGPLLDASHRSLAEDYEVSSPELDLAVDAARRGGALGARMIGAGFGGCALALVAEARRTQVTDSVLSAFAEQGLVVPSLMEVWPSHGARRLA
jgi:galactokinase